MTLDERIQARIADAKQQGEQVVHAQQKVYWTGVHKGLKIALRMVQVEGRRR